ncbi:hypothetical protein [Photobacterium leiognathi]|uniref:hypothetical protein n=1 Tax=Photobacterium leiognathi TaxID=553611 RepID=UPI002739A67A|nr:hypothetical protein [Photobacterium leiognathi]
MMRTRIAETTHALSEIIDDKRTIRQAERNYVDSNMLMFLPPFVSYIFTATDTPRPSLIAPIKVEKTDLKIYSCAEKENTTPELDKNLNEPEVADNPSNTENEMPEPHKNINEPDKEVTQKLSVDDNSSSTESETPKSTENVNEPDKEVTQCLRVEDNPSNTENEIPEPNKNNKTNNEHIHISASKSHEKDNNSPYDDTVEIELLDNFVNKLFEEN